MGLMVRNLTFQLNCSRIQCILDYSYFIIVLGIGMQT